MLSDTQTLFSTVVTGTSSDWPLHTFDRIATSIAWAADTAAGVIVYEVAPSSGYSGTWKTIATYTAINDAAGAFDGESLDWAGDVWIRARFTTNATAGKFPTVKITRQKIGLG